ncbi:MAG: endonuclease/exonuclease/phosphatase family protein [Marinifilaceae bacterium]|nr:endonuclease/exonuclease/phosphatase family protein [Marinifilaceae bacterium]
MVKRIIDTIFLVITWVAIIGLVGSYTAPYVDPNVFYFSSLLGLAYHYLLIANLLLFFYWLVRWKRMAIISFLVILAGYPFLRGYYGFNSRSLPETSCDIEVMSYNIRQLNLYGNKSLKGITDYIETFKGDFVCLQEFPRKGVGLQHFPSYVDYHSKGDVAILSRRPILHRGNITFPKGCSAACVYGDIVLEWDTVRVYCVHLESYRLGKKEQQIYQELRDGNSEDIQQGVRTLLQRLVLANKNRAKEATTIKNHMRKSPYPIILCGDFNDTPLSYPYHVLHEDMLDSFIEKGHGLGNTYIGEFPSFRIDHILHTPSLQTVAYTRDTIRCSDHYAIRAKILLK